MAPAQDISGHPQRPAADPAWAGNLEGELACRIWVVLSYQLFRHLNVLMASLLAT